MRRYVLVTPAHNEEAFIERTIVSVIRQTVRPAKWVIVNDGSTDRTREIVEHCIAGHEFIELLNLERPPGRHFGHKARAFNLGCRHLSTVDYNFIGNLDADVSLEPTYYEQLLEEFDRDPNLGIAGGMVHSLYGNSYVSQNVALDSVAGAVQLFRRGCFCAAGGYLELPYGGIDTAAEVMARMRGWRVRTFPQLRVLEHRRTDFVNASLVASCINEGRRMHSLGYGFVFFLLRALYRANERPRFLKGVALLWGFCSAKLWREPVVLPAHVVCYLRAEQKAKIKSLARCALGRMGLVLRPVLPQGSRAGKE
jgi:biofilm PGA synthesis N-glycosyltransferase PgaC